MYKNWSNGFLRVFVLVGFLGLVSIVTTYYSVSAKHSGISWGKPALNLTSVKLLLFPLFIAVTYFNGYVFVSSKLKLNLKNKVNIFLTFCIGLLIDVLLSVGFLIVLYILKEIYNLI